MTVRDRFDAGPGGKDRERAAEQRAGYVRGLVQTTSALRSFELASAAVRAGTACAFAVDLVASWHEQRRQEGW